MKMGERFMFELHNASKQNVIECPSGHLGIVYKYKECFEGHISKRKPKNFWRKTMQKRSCICTVTKCEENELLFFTKLYSYGECQSCCDA